jgi:diaminopimelate epimerase
MGAVRGGRVGVGLDRSALGMSPEGTPTPDGTERIRHPSLGELAFLPVSVGNPHAVLFPDDPSDELLREVGPFFSGHPAFRGGTNVQLVQVLGADRIRIWIWERGVGRTPASGTSSCASAVAAVHSGRVPPGRIVVEMDGGTLEVAVDASLEVVLRGPVEEVSTGRLTEGFCGRLSGPASRGEE